MNTEAPQKNTQFKKGQTPWNKGIKMSDEFKSKMNLSGLSVGHGWNKGKECDWKGEKHWNWKGGDKDFCLCGNIKSKIADSCRKCGGKKVSKAMIGNKRFSGHKHSDETKKKFSYFRVNNPNRVYKDTGIEIKIENLLNEFRIPYLKQIPLFNVTISDFYLEKYKIAIFCDGCYWHGCPIHRSIDKAIELNKKQNRILIQNGISVIRLWEHDINKNPEMCIQKIINLINYKN